MRNVDNYVVKSMIVVWCEHLPKHLAVLYSAQSNWNRILVFENWEKSICSVSSWNNCLCLYFHSLDTVHAVDVNYVLHNGATMFAIQHF